MTHGFFYVVAATNKQTKKIKANIQQPTTKRIRFWKWGILDLHFYMVLIEQNIFVYIKNFIWGK